MNLTDFNNNDRDSVKEQLFQCCGSSMWVQRMMNHFPFTSEKKLIDAATHIWYQECKESDWREAFTHHPQIGDIDSLQKKFASTQHLAANEQAGMDSANENIIQILAQANTDYTNKNEFIFIVCATNKSALEMLRLLQDRLRNDVEEELLIAMGEQQKITVIRLKKLIHKQSWSAYASCQLTTHVLDTSIGKPGQSISIKLQQFENDRWSTIAQGVTNNDGRIADLLPPGRLLSPQKYRMVFDTDAYFNQCGTIGFYPVVEIQFTIFDDQHYHVPLLLNPYGYSTYRGS